LDLVLCFTEYIPKLIISNKKLIWKNLDTVSTTQFELTDGSTTSQPK